MEAKEHQSHNMTEIKETRKAASTSDEGQCSRDDALKRIEELDTELAELRDESDFQDQNVKLLMRKEKKSNEELIGARAVGLQTLRYLELKKEIIDDIFEGVQIEDSNSIPKVDVKIVGNIDSAPWWKAFQERKIGWVLGSTMLQTWIERIRDPSYQPFKKEKYGAGDDEWKQVVDENDEHLSKLREDLGEAVQQTVVVALQEIEEHNASGRYPEPRAWILDDAEPRPADLKDVLKYLSLVIQALVLEVEATRPPVEVE